LCILFCQQFNISKLILKIVTEIHLFLFTIDHGMGKFLFKITIFINLNNKICALICFYSLFIVNNCLIYGFSYIRMIVLKNITFLKKDVVLRQWIVGHFSSFLLYLN